MWGILRTGGGRDNSHMTAEDPTVAEMLTKVNAAIYAILTRAIESYTVHGITYTYSNLDQLRLMRNELKKEVNGTTRRRIMLADVRGRAG